ncbi:MAG: GNAT family N-acetyltransferase [Burkholderiales bacterium]|nr:GNAT family N-acetyltransferase [Phycisphaerae bacterium]
MKFLTLDNPCDRELELVQPASRWIDDMVAACQHPVSWGDTGALWTHDRLREFVSSFPSGFEYGDELLGRSPGYYLWMRLLPKYKPPVPMAGTISLRVSDAVHIRRYSGHIGYGVFPPARGNHYAERATRLLMPLAKKHGMDHLWITCNPDNLASRRTCERLSATLVEIVDVPPGNPLYAKGDRQKCRYHLPLP